MLQKDISYVKMTLDEVLGQPLPRSGGEYIYHCPFCNHYKHKLQISIQDEKWHCWVCNAKGKKITSLLRKLDVDVRKIQKITSIYKDSENNPIVHKTENSVLKLPFEFKKLSIKPKGINPLYNNIIHYLKNRDIGIGEILKYNIGYCESGIYAGRVIVPSYDSNGVLNYFIARTIYDDVPLKYMNPKVSKNIIMFENQINWDYPITLTEGVFDAITIKRNVIPILSKFIPKKLIDSIYLHNVKNINIVLDDDAKKESLKYALDFMNNGINVKFINPSGKDANEIGFKQITKDINNATEIQFDELIKHKLELI